MQIAALFPRKKEMIVRLCGVFIIAVSLLCLAPMGAAQDAPENRLSAPNFSAVFLDEQKGKLAVNTDLTPEQITSASENFDAARGALEAAAVNLEQITRYRREIESTPEMLERLRETFSEAQPGAAPLPSSENDVITGETLLKLRQELVGKEGDLRNLRAEIVNYEAELQNMTQRPVREDLSDARARLAELSGQLEAMSELSDLGAVERSRRYLLEARQYQRQTQIQALELELAGQSGRQQLLNLRRDIAQLGVQQGEQAVINLQTRTGQRRLMQAKEIGSATVDMVSIMENAHPFLLDYAGENLAISEKLRVIAGGASDLPQLQADARTRSDTIRNDLDIARQLTQLDKINRQSSAMLRRLRNQRPSSKAIRTEIAETRRDVIAATQERLWAQERLREFPAGWASASFISQRSDINGVPLGAQEINQLQALMTARRGLLLELSDAAFSRISDSNDLETLQLELLEQAEALRGLLDQKLLWLPSVASIDGSWPQKFIRGGLKVFSFENIQTSLSVSAAQTKRYILLVLVFVIAAGAATMIRRRLRLDIKRIASKVGRVQKDSYWHTPNVIASSAIIAAPIPLILMLVGILFQSSPSPDPNIQAYGQTAIELSGFALFFLTWREWNRDSSLLGAHYNLPGNIRKRIARQLAWFIPFGGLSIAMVTVTQNSREPDVYEGFSLLAFVVTAIALSVFAGKILWANREAFKNALPEGSTLWRYHRFIAFVFIGLPGMAALLAAAGYYDTARELLSRLFFSGGLLIGTYVIYGLIKRTVVVAQRRLALRQAIERREISLKARAEKEAAEERGDAPPPPVNYEEIDLETLSRQSAQLLNTFVLIGFAVLMWIFWQDLLPALSIFDGVGLWPHDVLGDDGQTIKDWVTLWDVMQALAIIVITFLAARNLPGFLEVFVLNRSKFDAGTRYAIVSVLGYVIIAIGIIAAFNKLGTEWSQMQWIVAALGVGIGFGLQEIIANFISGLIILFERPVRIGDYVTIGDQSGTVTRIQIRATTLGDLDRREILIPNKELITGRVMNWTLSNSETRMIIHVGIAYGSDTDKARDIMLKVISSNAKVLDTPQPQVFFLGFGDSALNFELRIFLRSFEDRYPVSHAIHTDINRALEKAGISIPFPQRDVHIIGKSDET